MSAMYDELALYCDLLPLSRYQSILKLEDIFESINYTDHQIRVYNLKGDDEIDDTSKGVALQDIYDDQMDSVYFHLGISLDGDIEISFTDKVDIISSIFSCEGTENIDELNRALEGVDGLSDEDTLVFILQKIHPRPFEWYDARIESVQTGLIQRLKAVGMRPENQQEPLQITEDVKKEFLAFIKDDRGVIYQLVVTIGHLPIAWTRVVIALGDLFQTTDTSDIAKQLYAGCIVANIPMAERFDKGSVVLRKLIDDMKILTVAEDTFYQLTEELQHANESN